MEDIEDTCDVAIDWLTIHEVAVRLDLHYQTVINFIRSGKLKAIKVGGQWRVTSEELLRFRTQGNLPQKEGL